MKTNWLSESSFELIKSTLLKERGFEIGEPIGEGKGSIVLSLKDSSMLCCKVRPYFEPNVRRIYYARAAYKHDMNRFPLLLIPDPNRRIEFEINSDEFTEESRDQEIEPIVTKEGAFLVTIHEKLYPVRSFSEQELLKLVMDIAEVLDELYDPLRFALHGISQEDIMFSHSLNRYTLHDCSKISRFIDDQVRFRYGDPSSSAPELYNYHYFESTSTYSLGCYLRAIVTEGITPEKEITDAVTKINASISPAAVMLGKKRLNPLDEKNPSKYSGDFINLINRMTAFHPADRLTPGDVAEAACQLIEKTASLREEKNI